MATYPEIHPEKCPFCGGQLKLFTGKYLWDYYYQCAKCYPIRRFHFKNDAPPDIKAIYNTEEYKNHKEAKERRERDDAEFKATHPYLFADYTGKQSTPASTSVNLGGSFMPYICKQFQDMSNYRGQSSSAIDELQTYLNTHRITRDRIVSLNTAAYGGIVVITLVYV